MKSINELKNQMPQVGKIEWIGLRPKRKAQPEEVNTVEITKSNGLIGDHNDHEGGKRMVTLIQKEHIEAVGSIIGKQIKPADLRRNIVVSGINLLALHDQIFQLGEDVVLQGTGYCVPCSRMEENLGPGGYNAMRGHGGITATVISGGEIQIGDHVSLHS